MRKALTILTISLLILSSFSVITPMVGGFQMPPGADASDWYMTVEGEKLKIGFSKFGEMINSIDNVGLEYGGLTGRDPFAPPAGPTESLAMPKRVWLEGWLINITYFTAYTPLFKMRNVWATAQHADIDSLEYGNDWVRIDDNYQGGPASESDEKPYCGNIGYFIGTSPAEYGTGGRVTNGTVVTEPIKVLYDDSRRFVAQIVNHVYDWVQTGTSTTAVTNIHLVDVIITIDFNKDKKEVQLIKDVKLIPIKGIFSDIPRRFWLNLPEEYGIYTYNGEDYIIKYDEVAETWYGYDEDDGLWDIALPGDYEVDIPITSPIEGIFVQFSSRAIWDLGKPDYYKSYAHFYTEGDMSPPYDYWLDSWPIDDPWVEGLYTPYDYDYASTTTIFPNYWSRHGPEPNESDGDTFDVAQIISDDEKYVGWAAYWPSLSDWSVRGIELGQWWKSLTSYDLHPADYEGEDWMSPYTIGEWDFVLSKHPTTVMVDDEPVIKIDRMFTSITTYGLTDLHTEEPWIDYEWNEYWSGYPRVLPVYVGAGHDNNMLPYAVPPLVELSERWDVVDREVASELAQTFVIENPFISAVESATGKGTVAFEPDIGSITGLVSMSVPTEGKPDLDFPYGFFSFNIMGIAPGATVTLTIILPSPVPVGTQYWKRQLIEESGDYYWEWYEVPMGDNDGDRIITIQLTDGGLGDSDGEENGVIVDPGGIGLVIMQATIDFHPDTLNLKSNGEWITCYIELPGYDVNQISIDSIKLTVSGEKFSVDPSAPTTIGDYDSDGIPDLMVKFDRLPIVSYLGTKDYYTYTGSGSLIQFTVTGTLTSWIPFKGYDTITVIKPGK